MTGLDATPLILAIFGWLVIAIAIAVAASYLTRPRVRALYPGGPRRYLLALTVQAAGFMVPIPFVLLLLMGRSISPWLDVVIAVAAGVAVVFLLRMAPVAGPLLKDLFRARVEAAMERMGPRDIVERSRTDGNQT